MNNHQSQEDLEFEQLLQKLENQEGINEEANLDLLPSPTPIQKIKYDLCQKLARYERKNGLDLETFAQQAQIDQRTAKIILYSHIDEIETDHLIEIASNIFNLEIGILKSQAKFFPVQKPSSQYPITK